MLTIEDLHWAVAATLAYAAELAATASECPVVLIMTSRLEGDPLDHDWRSLAHGSPLMTIDLGPLRKDEALALAGTIIAASEQADVYVERSGGHPLFLEQLLRNARETGLAEIPASIHSVVLARMDALAPDDKQALQSASVLGQRFSLDALHHLTGNSNYSYAGLIQHHLVRPESEGFF
jgi:predicted ATPase